MHLLVKPRPRDLMSNEEVLRSGNAVHQRQGAVNSGEILQNLSTRAHRRSRYSLWKLEKKRVNPVINFQSLPKLARPMIGVQLQAR